MPRIRTIKPEFWKSESIATLPFRVRLTFIGLWTYVDDNGVGLDNYKLIAAELFGLEEDPREARANVREDLARLHEAGRILRYTVGGKRYLAIVNWSEHQKIDKPGRPRHPSADADSAQLLSSEDASKMDGGGPVPKQLSRDSRESLTPGTEEQGSGNRDQGTGDSAKADTARAMSAAQPAFAGMPASDPKPIPATAGAIVAAYCDGAKAAGLDIPSETLRARVGKAGRKLLAESKDFQKLIAAATEMGGSGHNDLDVAYRRIDAARNNASAGKTNGAGYRNGKHETFKNPTNEGAYEGVL